MRISFISDAQLVNSNYRTYLPMAALEQLGHEAVYNRIGAPRYRERTLSQSDIIHVHRYIDSDLIESIARMRTSGVGVLWDNDDDITAVPRENPHYRAIGSPAQMPKVRAALQRAVLTADVVSTPSYVLAEQFVRFGARDVRVLENFLAPRAPLIRPAAHTGLVIAWLAGLEHQLDYQRLRLQLVLEALLQAHSTLRVVSIGLGLGLPRDRYTHYPLVDFNAIVRVLSSADIGIAPLVDIPWNRARSNIKLKEYGAAGLPWLASPVSPYVNLGHKQGGQLVADDEWFQSLDALIRSPRRRRKLARNAARWARNQTIDRHVHLWLQAYEAASRSARSRTAARGRQ